MNAGKNGRNLDELIARSIGRDDLQFDFDKWKQTHEEQIRIHRSTARSGPDVEATLSLMIRRHIMKSNAAKLAVAAVIVVTALIGISYLGAPVDIAGVAVADVVEPLLHSDTGSFKMTLDLAGAGIDWADGGENPLQTVDVRFSGLAKVRWDFPAGEVLVANFERGKVMVLIPHKRQVNIMQVGPPGVVPPLNRFNALVAIRPLIEYALATEDESVESLGQRQIDGVDAVGYRLTGPAHHGEITVWADPVTGQPILIERDMKQQNQNVLLTNIAFGIELDDSVFSVEPPQEYLPVVSNGESEPGFAVRGLVTDAATGRPIPGARVADDGYGPEPCRGAACDEEGRYEYNTWAEEHSIIATAPGYRPQRRDLTGLFHTESGKEAVMDFALERE